MDKVKVLIKIKNRKFIFVLILISFIFSNNCKKIFEEFKTKEAKKIILKFGKYFKEKKILNKDELFCENAKFIFSNQIINYKDALVNFDKNFIRSKFTGDLYIHEKSYVKNDIVEYSYICWLHIPKCWGENFGKIKLKKCAKKWKIFEIKSENKCFVKLFEP